MVFQGDILQVCCTNEERVQHVPARAAVMSGRPVAPVAPASLSPDGSSGLV